MLLLYYFLDTVYFCVVTSDKMFFSCISISTLPYVQRYFPKEAGENFFMYSIKIS